MSSAKRPDYEHREPIIASKCFPFFRITNRLHTETGKESLVSICKGKSERPHVRSSLPLEIFSNHNTLCGSCQGILKIFSKKLKKGLDKSGKMCIMSCIQGKGVRERWLTGAVFLFFTGIGKCEKMTSRRIPADKIKNKEIEIGRIFIEWNARCLADWFRRYARERNGAVRLARCDDRQGLLRDLAGEFRRRSPGEKLPCAGGLRLPKGFRIPDTSATATFSCAMGRILSRCARMSRAGSAFRNREQTLTDQ